MGCLSEAVPSGVVSLDQLELSGKDVWYYDNLTLKSVANKPCSAVRGSRRDGRRTLQA